MTPTNTIPTAATTLLLVAAGLLVIAAPGAAQEQSSIEYDVYPEEDHLAGEPQASLQFQITIENYADAATFTFESPEEELSEFQVIDPSPLALPAGQPEDPAVTTVSLLVYTPFHNGYVNEEAEIPLTVHATHESDEDVQGESKTIQVTAQAQGLHIPHPLVAPLAALALAALLPTSRRPTQGQGEERER